MASRDPDRPNVIVILSDDQGVWAMGDRNPEIQTPVLDRLSTEGTRLENFFCTSPVCSPSRASLLTGRIPSRHGIHDWLRDGNEDCLSGQLTYVEVLRDAGWRCGQIGKWHLGADRRPCPEYAHWFVYLSGGYRDPTLARGDEVEPVPGYLTAILTSDARDFIAREAPREEPFYLSLNHIAPHAPWTDQHPPDYVDAYLNSRFESCPQLPPHPWRLDFSQTMVHAYERPRENLAGYFAAVSAMDAGIGEVVSELAHHGLLESTLILFLSDNGFNAGHHGIWGKGNATYPANMYDTSVRVPAIAYQPGLVSAGGLRLELLSGYDLSPTILDWVGLDSGAHPAGMQPGLPGQSFAGLLRGEGSGDRQIVVYDEYGPTRMIRTDEWKYVHRHGVGPDELYNLVRDPHETTNLVDLLAHHTQVQELSLRMQEWFALHSDPMRDGSVLPVTGVGQSGPLGKPGEAQPFYPIPAEPDSAV